MSIAQEKLSQYLSSNKICSDRLFAAAEGAEFIRHGQTRTDCNETCDEYHFEDGSVLVFPEFEGDAFAV